MNITLLFCVGFSRKQLLEILANFIHDLLDGEEMTRYWARGSEREREREREKACRVKLLMP
jgi:hypothetical protein